MDPREILIHDANYWQHKDAPDPNARGHWPGLVPRNFETHPQGYLACAKPFTIPKIPRSEWDARIADRTAAKAWLSDLRMVSGPAGQKIPSRDQDGKGYCWAHSGTSAMLLARALAGEPYADLSAYMVACLIKGYRDEGGWGAEGVEFAAENGIPTAEFWPQQSMSRANDNPAMRANAKLHRWGEWQDLPERDFDAQATCALLGLPVVVDFNWWSHSVCQMDLVSGVSQRASCRCPVSGKLLALKVFDEWWGMDTEAGGYGSRIWNSWNDTWSLNGTGTLAGTRAIADGALVCLTPTASAA